MALQIQGSALFRTLLACAGMLAFSCAGAQTWPERPIRVVVGYAAGGPTDQTARMLSDRLPALLGQPVVVDNRPGAAQKIAAEYVAAAAPDGYTLLLAAAPITMAPFLDKSVKYHPVKNFEPVANVMTSPSVLALSPKLKDVKDFKALIERARQAPGTISYASSGAGGTQHLLGELLAQRAGVKLIHVPYKGAAPALVDVLAGHVDIGIMTAMSALPTLQQGNPRPVAVSSDTRLKQLPDVPTIAEAGIPWVEVQSWNGLFAPVGTPAAVVEKLNAAVNKVLSDPGVLKTLDDQGAVAVGGSAAEFRRYVEAEVERWGSFLQNVDISAK